MTTSNTISCLHARRIKIATADEGNVSGIIGIFQPLDETTDRSFLIRVSDGSSDLFEESVTAQSAQESIGSMASLDGKKPPLEYLLSLLIQENDNRRDNDHAKVDVIFRLEGADQTKLVIQVRERTKSGIVRLPWTSTLLRSSGGEDSSLLSLTTSLIDAIHREQKRADQLDSDRNILKRNRDEWKDTAEKLEGEWEREKTQLLQNFLKLYNARKDYIKHLEKKLADVEGTDRRLATQTRASGDGDASSDSEVQKRKPSARPRKRGRVKRDDEE